MEREDCRRLPLIVPMNLRASPSVEATRSMAGVSFGAFVPVGKIGSGALHVNCLATPMRCSRWEALLSFCLRARRVASSLNSKIEKPPCRSGRGLCCLGRRANSGLNFICNDLPIPRFMGREHLQNSDVNRGHEPDG